LEPFVAVAAHKVATAVPARTVRRDSSVRSGFVLLGILKLLAIPAGIDTFVVVGDSKMADHNAFRRRGLREVGHPDESSFVPSAPDTRR